MSSYIIAKVSDFSDYLLTKPGSSNYCPTYSEWNSVKVMNGYTFKVLRMNSATGSVYASNELVCLWDIIATGNLSTTVEVILTASTDSVKYTINGKTYRISKGDSQTIDYTITDELNATIDGAAFLIAGGSNISQYISCTDNTGGLSVNISSDPSESFSFVIPVSNSPFTLSY